ADVRREYLLEQVMHNDVGKRLQVGQEVTELILDGEKSPELEQDQATAAVNSLSLHFNENKLSS
uniref:Uncharacterized protein n=1 Tax=Seriola lalandi dorsalis TaxID=1841481 RepID=A0A3B4WJM4_SERLL